MVAGIRLGVGETGVSGEDCCQGLGAAHAQWRGAAASQAQMVSILWEGRAQGLLIFQKKDF